MKHLLFFVLFLSCGSLRAQVTFGWKDSIQDDFSFTENWTYDEGIYLNEWGQLSCDGWCPSEIFPLMDTQGRIYDDSLTKFYALVDTTHRYFTLEGTARVYELGTCNFAFATKNTWKGACSNGGECGHTHVIAHRF